MIERKRELLLVAAWLVFVITLGWAFVTLSQNTGLSVNPCFVTRNGMVIVIHNDGNSPFTIQSYTFSNSTFQHLRTGPITIPSGLSFSDSVFGNFTASKYDFAFTLSSGTTVRLNVECFQGV